MIILLLATTTTSLIKLLFQKLIVYIMNNRCANFGCHISNNNGDNQGGIIRLPGIECFAAPRSDRVKVSALDLAFSVYFKKQLQPVMRTNTVKVIWKQRKTSRWKRNPLQERVQSTSRILLQHQQLFQSNDPHHCWSKEQRLTSVMLIVVKELGQSLGQVVSNLYCSPCRYL